MELESLDSLRDREHRLLDDEYDYTVGIHYNTPVDKFMEINDDRLGEDSEEATMWSHRSGRLLQERSLQSY